VPKYGKNYKDTTEYAKRKKAFTDNYNKIIAHNSTKAGFELNVNQFADWTADEFKATLKFNLKSAKGYGKLSKRPSGSGGTATPTVTTFDWRNSGAVTAVKNQGSCGSCYAFASAGALEGLYKLKYGSLVDFSTQQVVDCSSAQGNGGCNGGNMENSFIYWQTSKAQTWSSYPYVAK
jgi:C1A family cysteine protease